MSARIAQLRVVLAEAETALRTGRDTRTTLLLIEVVRKEIAALEDVLYNQTGLRRSNAVCFNTGH